MSEISTAYSKVNTQKREAAKATSRARFDWAIVILSAVFLGGLFLDGWAHTHGFVDETFFTPWHALLYGGWFLMGLFLGTSLLQNVSRGISWREALPAGYGLSLIGVLLWLPGGVGDLLWHTAFGFEENVDILYSPTHLILATGFFLMASGPLRAAWQRKTPENGWRQLPALLSLVFTLSLLTLFTQIAYPIANLWGVGTNVPPYDLMELGVVSFLLDTVLLMGFLFLAMRRWTLPRGAFTLIFTLNAVAMGFLFDQGPYPWPFVIARSMAGMLADWLYWRWQPSWQGRTTLRWFAFTVPAATTALHFLTAQIVTGITWTIHLWLGTVFTAGIAGLLLSYVAAPPAQEVGSARAESVPNK